jgi:DNA invertase Pin-like site-specific DNA recombinase
MTERARVSGYTVVATLQEVYTGFELDERPLLSRLRQMMPDGLVDVILVNELDRLTRSQTHLEVRFIRQNAVASRSRPV